MAGDLLCGDTASASGDLADTLTHLNDTIRSLIELLPAPRGAGTPSVIITPYVCRSLIDVATTALIARVDPFRILTLRRVQLSSDFDVGRKTACSVQWHGDVVAPEKVTDPWSSNRRSDQMTRALLGDYQAELIWRPAFERAVDFISTRPSTTEWTRELQRVDLDAFAPQLRQMAVSAYSTASKGVHHELLIPPTSYYDDATLVDLVETSVKVCGWAGLAINFCEYNVFGWDSNATVDKFEELG